MLALVGEIDSERIWVWAACLVEGQHDDRLMESVGINRGDHPPFLRLELHEAVDSVDANQLDEEGHETKVETAEFSFSE